MTPGEFAALRVTVLDALEAEAAKELGNARGEAEVAFKAAVDGTGLRASTGALQVEILMPDGTGIGHLSIKAGAKSSETDEVGLHEWVAERNREALEEVALPEAAVDDRVLDLVAEKCPNLISLSLKPGALEDPRVAELLSSEFPDLLTSRVRPGALKAYVKEADKVAPGSPKGWLVDPETGERLHLVKRTEEPPSGAFAFIGAETPARRAAVMAALAAGDPVVRAIAFGAVGELGPSTAPDGDDL